MIKPADLGVCLATSTKETPGAPRSRMRAGMSALWYTFDPLLAEGERIVLGWDRFSTARRIRPNGRKARTEAVATFADDVSPPIAKVADDACRVPRG